MKPLHLALKKKWFDLIDSGVKTEEYRDVKPYWEKRLLNYKGIKANWKNLIFREFLTGRFDACADYPRGFTHVVFRNGYAKDAPRMTFKLESITIGEGREEWGAAPNKQYFIIKLGERI